MYIPNLPRLGCHIDLAEWWSCGVSSNAFCVVSPARFGTFFLTLPPPKGNTCISALKLAMVTNEVIVKQKEHTLQWYIQHNKPHFQITPERRFPKYSKLFVLA